MTKSCKCNVGLANTRLPNGCQHIGKVTERLIFTHYFDEDGAVKKLDLSTFTGSQADFDALTNAAAKTDRWFPIEKKFENVETGRSESTFDEFDSGLKFFVQRGIKSFAGLLPETANGLITFFNTAKCVDLGVYLVDSEGNIIGNGDEYGFLKPLRIARGTLDAMEVAAKDKNVQRIAVKFEFDEAEEDEDIMMVEAGEMTANVKTLRGLMDADGYFTSITDETFDVEIYTPYGTAKNRLLVTGLVIGDFTLLDNDGVPITITSVTESPTKLGKYSFVYPTQTSGDKLKLTFEKTGYDSTNLGATTILIP